VSSRESWVTPVTGQFTDGSRGSRVTKCDPLSALRQTVTDRPIGRQTGFFYFFNKKETT